MFPTVRHRVVPITHVMPILQPLGAMGTTHRSGMGPLRWTSTAPTVPFSRCCVVGMRAQPYETERAHVVTHSVRLYSNRAVGCPARNLRLGSCAVEMSAVDARTLAADEPTASMHSAGQESTTVETTSTSGAETGATATITTDTWYRHWLTHIATLGKLRLSVLVAYTTASGCVVSAPLGVHLLPLVVGTFLQAMSANTANQILEVTQDATMKRTHKRPLVTGAVVREQAILLAAGELLLGTALLYTYAPAVAALGVANWFLYVVVYTSLKTRSIWNTEVGAFVGAIPPIMGGCVEPYSAPAWWLGAILYAWQMPHFHALAHFCRRDYKQAGYTMLAFEHPTVAARSALAFALVLQALILTGPVYLFGVPPLFPLPLACIYYGASIPLTCGMTWKTWLYYVDPTKHCRACFVFSYVFLALQLNVIMFTMLLQRNWGGKAKGEDNNNKEKEGEVKE